MRRCRRPWPRCPPTAFATAAQFAEALGTPATVAIAVGAAQAMVRRQVQEVAAAKSVAVLPFENMSTDPENEYFSDGITDDIIAQLSKISALKVISRTSSMQYKKTTKKITAIAEELGVGAILEGSVRRAGPRVRIVVHLVDPQHREASLGRHLRPPAQRHLRGAERGGAADHRGALRWPCRPRRSSGSRRRPTGDADAYNLYLLGRFHTNKWSEANVQKGIEYFQRRDRQGSGLRRRVRRSGRRLRAAQHRVQLQAAGRSTWRRRRPWP